MYIIIILLATAAYFATDIYLPAMPEICTYFHVEEDAMQLSVSLFTLGIAASQIFYGALSDKIGRKLSLSIGLSFSLIGTLFLINSETITYFNIGRLLQGLGLGCCVAVPRSILPDLYSGKQLALYGSYMAMSIPLVLSSAPIIGGYIQYLYSWRHIFQFLFVYGIILILLVVLKLPETNKSRNKNALKIKDITVNIKSICSDPSYISGMLCSCSLMAALFFYIAASPFIIQEQAGATYIEYSWLMGANGFMVMFGAMINRYLLNKVSLKQSIKIGAILTILSGISIYSINHILPQITPFSIAIPSFFVLIASAFTFPNALAVCLRNVAKNMNGLAVAFFSTIQMIGAFLGSYATALIDNDGVISLSIAIITTGLISFISISYKQRQ